MTISARTVVLVVIALLAGAAIGYAWRAVRAASEHARLEQAEARMGELTEKAREDSSRIEELGAMNARLSADLSAASARASLLEQENNEHIERARTDNSLLRRIAPLEAGLDKMGNSLAELNRAQAAQRSELSTQLKRAAEVQDSLARETVSLRGALTSSSARGVWGEAELRRIVEAAGMLEHVDFDTQQSMGSASGRKDGARPDLVVHLPGDAHLAVDAKVPLAAMLKAQAETGTDSGALKRRSDLLAEHAKAVRAHVRELNKRNYPAAFPGSPQFTVMYLPSDSMLSEALRADATLLDDAYAAQVIPAGPSSLLALLRSVAAVWSSASVTEEAQEIVALGRELAARLSTTADHLDALGTSLRRSVQNYNATVGSLESRVLVTARRFSSLDVQIGSARQIDPDAAQVRQLASPEFAARGLTPADREPAQHTAPERGSAQSASPAPSPDAAGEHGTSDVDRPGSGKEA